MKNTDYIGIIGAMEIEIAKLKELLEIESSETISDIEYTIGKLFNHNVVVAYSGVGKVYSAMCTQTMILKYNPTTIINIGVAGGDHRIVNNGDVIIGEKVIQHDFDTSAVGDPKCLISGINLIEIPCTDSLSNSIFDTASEMKGFATYKGIIATGDKFMNNVNDIQNISNEFNAIAFDMESASIGQVCFINNVNYSVIRSISDSGSEYSGNEYFEFLKKCAMLSINVLCEYLKS